MKTERLEHSFTVFEDGERGHEPRNVRSRDLEAEKGKELDSPLEPPEGAKSPLIPRF